VPYGIPFGLRRNVVRTNYQIIYKEYRIYSRNLRTFSSLAAEKSGRVKYADFFV
jgi:hypothetical protein